MCSVTSLMKLCLSSFKRDSKVSFTFAFSGYWSSLSLESAVKAEHEELQVQVWNPTKDQGTTESLVQGKAASWSLSLGRKRKRKKKKRHCRPEWKSRYNNVWARLFERSLITAYLRKRQEEGLSPQPLMREVKYLPLLFAAISRIAFSL